MKTPWSRRETRRTELDEEIESHFDMAVRDRIARGETPEQAYASARREFGNVGHVKEVTRDAWGGVWLDRLLQDLRFAFRSLRRQPSFTIVATLTLALGIGATTAMFTIMNGVLFRPLPFPEPEQLYAPSYKSTNGMFSPYPGMDDRHFIAFQNDTSIFSHVAAYRQITVTLTGVGEPAKVEAAPVSADFFTTLGVVAARGRLFSADEVRANAPVAVLSDAAWRNRFAADPRAIGGTATIDGKLHTIVGVLPPGMTFPTTSDVWTPMSMQLDPRFTMFLRTVARLRSDVTGERARAGFAARASTFELLDGELRTERNAAVVPLKDVVVGDARRVLSIFTGAVVFVLLIACANVANLLLMRVTTRDREMAVRAALGAGRWRLVRQLITESVALSSIAATLGVGIAFVAIRLFVAFAPEGTVPRASEVHIDRVALAFTAGVSILAAIVCGLVPALHATERRLHASLSAGARSIAGSTTRLRSALVIGELAMSLVLLAGAGLLLKSFERLRSVDLGFTGANTLAVTVDLPGTSYRDAAAMQAFYDRVLPRFAALPGVESAGSVNWIPLGGGLIRGDFILEDRRPLPDGYTADKLVVSPGYFRSAGVRLESGRDFSASDARGAPGVVIVSRAVADRFWPKGDALGKRITEVENPTPSDWMTIVGIVSDVRQEGPREAAHAATYVPVAQTTNAFFLGRATFVVRRAQSASVSSLATSIRQVLRDADPRLALETIKSLDERIAATNVRPRFQSRLLLIFSVAAVALAMIGIYGVLAYNVTQRMRELGVRIALGAAPREIVSIVLRRTAGLVLPGIALGLAAAFGLTRVLEKLLFDVTPTDPTTFAVVTTLIAAVAFCSALSPARRASQVDPMVALRPEG